MRIPVQLKKQLDMLHNNAIKKGSRFSGTRLVSLKALCDTVVNNHGLVTTYQVWRERVEELFVEIETIVKHSSTPLYPLYKSSYTDVGLNLFERYDVGIAYFEDINEHAEISYRTPKAQLVKAKFAINPVYAKYFKEIKSFADSEWIFTLNAIKESLSKDPNTLNVDCKGKGDKCETLFQEDVVQDEKENTGHIEIQYYLVKLGIVCGCQVYVAINDKNKRFDGEIFTDLCLRSLPNFGFDSETLKYINNIDVLWIKNKQIIAAIEIENTTSIYSGLLRMADLIALQPNNRIKCYIVAPDERQDKYFQEINRPTFSEGLRLNEICKFVPYTKVIETYKDLKKYHIPFFEPKLLDSIAVSLSE